MWLFAQDRGNLRSTVDSDRSHCCCHLPNNFCSRRIFPMLHNWTGHIRKMLLLRGMGGLRIPTENMVLNAHSVPHTKRHLDQFIRFSTAQHTHRQTDRQTVIHTDHTTFASHARRCGPSALHAKHASAAYCNRCLVVCVCVCVCVLDTW